MDTNKDNSRDLNDPYRNEPNWQEEALGLVRASGRFAVFTPLKKFVFIRVHSWFRGL